MKATTVGSSGIVHQVLTKDNYERWRVVMHNYLQGQGLWDIVQGKGLWDIEQGLRGGVGSVFEHETEAWKMKNAQALHIIQLSCGQEILDEISHFETAKAAWNHLFELYGKLKATSGAAQAITQDTQSKEEAGDEDVAEQTHPLLNPHQNRQHHEPYIGRYGLIPQIVQFFEPEEDPSTLPSLHDAVINGDVNFVEKLVKQGKGELLRKEDNNGYTALALAAHYTGNTDIAKLMVESKKGIREWLLEMPNKAGEIPVLLAAANGYKEMTTYLYSKTPQKVFDGEDPRNRVFLLARCIAAEIFGVALTLLTRYKNLSGESFSTNYSTKEILLGKPVEGKFFVLDLLAKMPSAFPSGSRFGFRQQFIYDILSIERELENNYKIDDIASYIQSITHVADKRRAYFRSLDYLHSGRQRQRRQQLLQQLWQLQQQFLQLQQQLLLQLRLRLLRPPQLQQQVKPFQQLLQLDQQWLQLLLQQQQQQQQLQQLQHHQQEQVLQQWQLQQQRQLQQLEKRKQSVHGFCKLVSNFLQLEKFFGPLLRRIANWFIQNFKRLNIFGPLLCGIANCFIKNFKRLNIFGIREIYDQKHTNYEVLGILKCFCERPYVMGELEKEAEAMLHAAQHGIVEFINAMWEAKPDLLFAVDSYKRDIFSYAVLNRKQNVFQLIHSLNGLQKEIFTYRTDAFGNNLLHMAAHLRPSSDPDSRSGAALQMQREIQWFKAVEEVVHPLCREAKNSDGKKPYELFTENHKELTKAGEEWAKQTASSFTIVGTLITTIMFAAAFTVPGGNNQDNGIPIFSHDKVFTTFLIADAVSFFTSAVSVIIFIGIQTSRYAEKDFLKSLPWKLLTGLLPLILSVCSMIVAFCVALGIILKGYPTNTWFILGPILSVASIPIIALVVSQLPLMYDIFHATWKNPISSIKNRG